MYKEEFINFPWSQNYVWFYENLNAYVDLPSTYWILLKFKGRNNNYQRSIVARPTNGDFTSPVYESNDRYVKFGCIPWMAKWNTDEQERDRKPYHIIGNIVVPTKQFYDIEVYYRTDYELDTAGATLIPEIKPVLYVTDQNRDANSYWDDYLNPAFVTYDSYTDNDLISVGMSDWGKPASASVDNRDVQYGTETWTLHY